MPKKPEDIQGVLTANGFQIMQSERKFYRNGVYETIEIHFDELSGHTVDSFIEKAKRRGWLAENFSCFQSADATAQSLPIHVSVNGNVDGILKKFSELSKLCENLIQSRKKYRIVKLEEAQKDSKVADL